MSSDVIIKARHLAKAYKLYDSPGDWLKQQVAGSIKTLYVADGDDVKPDETLVVIE